MPKQEQQSEPRTWWEYVSKYRGSDNNVAVAAKLGLTASSIARWETSTPKPESVRAFAHAYGREVLEAFVYAQFLTDKEAHVRLTIARNDEQTERQFMERLRRLYELSEQNLNDDDSSGE